MAAEAIRRFRSHSPEATEALGEALGRVVPAGTVLALVGDLGAGKTAFTRGLARGLAVEEAVTSPTFTLMHEAEGRLPFFHFDAWLAGREAAFLSGGAAELLGGEGVAVVEWADRVPSYLPRPRLELRLAHVSAKIRDLELALVSPPEGALEREAALAEALRGCLEGIGALPDLDELSESDDRPEPAGPGCVAGGG